VAIISMLLFYNNFVMASHLRLGFSKAPVQPLTVDS